MTKSIFIITCLFFFAGPSFAATYYADPAKGSMSNPGSEDKPWKTLEEAASSGKLKSLMGGDILYLRSGNHGAVVFQGDNSDMVTIAAEKG